MKKAPAKEDLIQKLVSDEARRLTIDLERRCADRTQEAQAARTEMEAFVYSISHDLRAPLVHIGGFVDLLINHAGEELDEKGRHYLRTIAASTYRMGRMLDDLLALTRVGDAEMHKLTIELDTLVREVIDELKPLAENRQIRWVIGELPAVEADPTLLRDVMGHLVANALKFTRAAADATIGIAAQRGDGETIIAVHDNGVGFDMKHQDRLFGVFQRLHATSEYEGSGVGLARVRRIVRRHGGRTWAESPASGGATFYFSLPDKTAATP